MAAPRVVVTRARHQAAGLVAELEHRGLEVELLPLLAVVPAADPAPLLTALEGLATYDWMLLTSANTVTAVARARPGPLPQGLSVGVVGPATARAAEEQGWQVHLEAPRADAEGLVAGLGDRVAGRRVLLPQAADARPVLARELAAGGAEVTAVVAYAKALPPEAGPRAAELFAATPLGWVTFTSPRIVAGFVALVEALGDWEARRGELRAASIGPVTTAALHRHGITPAVEAPTPGDAPLAAAIAEAVAEG